jgi:hypothetical protein
MERWVGRNGILGQLARDAGRRLCRRLTADGLAFAFCPREGGSEELSGVFGGLPDLASSSAMRAFNAFTCASNSSMRSSLAAICVRSRSIRVSNDATRWASSLLGESFFLLCMVSVNQLAALGSTPQTRVTTRQRVSSYESPVAADTEIDVRGFNQGLDP